MGRCVGVIPTDILSQNISQELTSDAKDLEKYFLSIFSLWNMQSHLSGSCKVEAGDKDPTYCPQADSQGDHGVTKPGIQVHLLQVFSFYRVRVAKTPDPAGSHSVSFSPSSAFTASALASATKL